MLGAMFSGRHAMQKDESGAHFIDRSAKWFDKILNCKRRHPCVSCRPTSLSPS